ncbi:hypothetical protein [Noviherbaspirillum autotrophicum]|uniref:Uncharacterized protein n=1 Tax=Noviherbaspirillum autotrophicum TaxID=709839 RepID=A0A0C2BTB9_9BURK|nr:hypothetical protein [Noviherbaspirillum autotrophicum]KIF83284.1 hypothetical protein TSA66_24570 [Noviherbaspirillum autotrophicum]
MFTFTISYSEAQDMLVENNMAWYWHPNMSAHATGKGLDEMTFEEMEDQLHAHVGIEEEFNGFELGLLTNVRFNIVRDYELARAGVCCHCRSRSDSFGI